MFESSSDAAAEVRRFQDRLRVLSEVTRTFTEATTDHARLLDSIARALGDVIKDACVVFLLSPDGALLEPASIHAHEPAALPQIRAMFAAGPLKVAEHPALVQVLGSGEPLLVPQVEQRLARSDTTQEQVEAQRQLGLHSFLVVALRLHGRSIGVLALGRFHAESPPFSADDRELARSLADHAALAIENARLFAAATQAQKAAEQAEQRTRESELAHRLLFESSPIATFVFDVESLRLVAANPAALALYGYSKEEFLQLGLNDLRLPEDQEALMAILRAVGESDAAGEARHRRKDGSLMHVEGRSHLSSFEGRPARFVVVSDVSERRRAEAALLESDGRLRRTIDSMLEGYTILGHDLRYLYVNDVGALQARMTREQMLGRTPMELLPSFEQTGMYALLQRCLKERVAVQVEEGLTHVDGSPGYFEVNVQPTPEGLLVLSIDTTERRRAATAREKLEQQLRQSQKMDAVGRLAGGVAHDFNNVLSVILGYAETMLLDLKPGDPMRDDVQEVQKAAERAAGLTKQLLMFSRQQVFEAKVLDLDDVLGGMDRMLRRVVGEQIELSLLLEPGLGRIRADRSGIEQVIMNLVVNARDAMPAGGKLTIETENVLLDRAFVDEHLGTEAGPYVMLAVTDTGVGIEQATRLRVFEPFFTTKPPGKGTGLGLSTVFGIVQQSGGGIWLYSEPGRGTTFKVYLPRVEAELDAEVVAHEGASVRGSGTILLVEDEPALRTVTRRILERYGYEVVAAQNAGEALLECEKLAGRVQLLLTDVVMPRMNGAELASRLGERWPQIKVLYMSGYTDGSIASHGVLEAGTAFLQKPFTSAQLARKIKSVLEADGGWPAPRRAANI